MNELALYTLSALVGIITGTVAGVCLARILEISPYLRGRWAQRIRCVFGQHATPIGGVELGDYVPSGRPEAKLRYRSYLVCSACKKELIGAESTK